MLIKSLCLLLVTICVLVTDVTAQQTFKLQFVDDKTDAPVPQVMVRGGRIPADAGGRLDVTGSVGDTVLVLSPDYPNYYVVLTHESLQTVRLSNEITPESIFSVVDETAEFPGGMKKYYQHFGKTMRYPAEARRNGIEGTDYSGQSVPPIPVQSVPL